LFILETSAINATRHERTQANNQPLHHRHRHHHKHQQLDGHQALTVSHVYRQDVGSGKIDTAFVQDTETRVIHQRATAIATDISTASFETAARTKTVNNQVSRHYPSKCNEMSERRVTNGIHQISSQLPAVAAKNGHPLVPLTAANAPAAAAETRKPHHQRPAIAVIQLSSSADDDKIVYHNRLKTTKQGTKRHQEITSVVANGPVPPRPLPPPSPTARRRSSVDGLGQVPVHLPTTDVSRLPASDSWKRRKAKKLAKRQTAEEQQRCRQT